MIDQLDPVLDAEPDRIRVARVGGEAAAALVRDPRAGGDLILVHRALGRIARARDQMVAGRHELDDVHSLADHFAAGAADLLRPVGEEREVVPVVVQHALVAEAAGDGDLRRTRPVARAGDAACVDLVPDHDVEAGLRRARADRRGHAVVDDRPRVVHGDERVLLGRDLGHRLRPGVAHVAMRVHEPRHQGGAVAIHHRSTPPRQFLAVPGDLLDAVALDRHLAPIGPLAVAVIDADIGEDGARHVPFLPENRGGRISHARPKAGARQCARGALTHQGLDGCCQGAPYRL